MGETRRVVGVDESGKGDFFGPLVVAAFLADDCKADELSALGVRDGKLIADKKTLEIDLKLRADFSHEILIVEPSDYNQRYALIKNLNKLLAEGHAEVIDRLLSEKQADLVISDKFGKPELVEGALAARGQNVPLEQMVRGERIIQVAAASILARAAFIREMQRLSEQYGITIPKGAAAQVDAAGRKIVRMHGIQTLPNLAKTHFKNYRRVVNPTLFTR
ncbi:MAG: ribonuclease HIII [candidate division Zixibacteria bacterium]|nr:ribonuclease HIII [candidate division Zixibacteria bacterium]MDH3938525.1 ribonuclease HIII [candidate division Zixibacteria bacterium]MDH4033439.1 ribonuclease HIII [candidate division Zixibacteria bacterium]